VARAALARAATAAALLTLVLLAAGACGGEDAEPSPTLAPSPSSSPAATATAVEPGASPAASPARPTQAASSFPPTVTTTPSGHSEALIGSVRIDDATGDVAGSTAVTPADGEPVTDLVAVELVGDGAQLLVRWITPAPVSPRLQADGTLAWLADIWVDGTPVYELAVRMERMQTAIYVLDLETDERVRLEIASVFGDRMEAPFPAYSLPKITGPFTWTASVVWTNAAGVSWADHVPDRAGSEPVEAERAAFP
jgi:hypothetical protein